jgi:hypothetical protein
VASKLVERETLNEPSLEKAASDYRATWGTSTDLRTGQTVLASRPRDGAINRIVTPTVPIQVTYELTALGTELTLRLRNLITWIDDHTSTILEAQAAAPAVALYANVEDARLKTSRCCPLGFR